MSKKLISIIIPSYNEENNIADLYKELKRTIFSLSYNFEIIFVDDGSNDGTFKELKKIRSKDKNIQILQLSRNFGKEIAMTAGINLCKGDACIILDCDLQHPPGLIPKFIKKWEKGAEIIIGVREKGSGEELIKKIGSIIFYKIINQVSNIKIIPYETDFRLMDRIVINEFNRFSEKNRMTRALVDWLGFKKDFIYFKANHRAQGKASYGLLKLVRLAFSSLVSLSLFPLRLAGYLGMFITFFSGIFGLFVFVEKYVLNDPWSLNFSGTAILAIIILFLVGIILICLGLITLYIANIHEEILNRPLYIIRKNQEETKGRRVVGK